MLVNCQMASLEICKLELVSPNPHLQTVCFLGFPALNFYSLTVSTVKKEWIPTSEHGALSQLRRKRLVPFRSSKVGTMGLLLDHIPCAVTTRERQRYWMTICVASLLSTIHSGVKDVRTIPWADWGPAATRISRFHRRWGSILPNPAGPFWIMDISPLVVRDYDPLRTRRALSTEEPTSPSCSRQLVLSPTRTSGNCWVAGAVETRLPFRDIVELKSRLDPYLGIVADREWIVEILAMVRFFCAFMFDVF
jgi:hypothetical protein